MLYLESPAYVGYSYCLDDYNCKIDWNDDNSAVDNLHALLFFFE